MSLPVISIFGVQMDCTNPEKTWYIHWMPGVILGIIQIYVTKIGIIVLKYYKAYRSDRFGELMDCDTSYNLISIERIQYIRFHF